MTPRCYLCPSAWGSDLVELTGPEAHHLARVLRVKAGDPVTCFDGAGREGQGRVLQVTRRGMTLELSRRRNVPERPWHLRLGVAVPADGRIAPIVNQATQLGVSELIPITTARTVVRVAPGKQAGQEARLRRIAIEAGKQSGASWLPTIRPVTPWPQVAASIPQRDLTLMATVQGPHACVRGLLAQKPVRDLLLLIGPEGDWTEAEILEGTAAGAHRFSLGPQVLRCETACVAAVSILSLLLRERANGPTG